MKWGKKGNLFLGWAFILNLMITERVSTIFFCCCWVFPFLWFSFTRLGVQINRNFHKIGPNDIVKFPGMNALSHPLLSPAADNKNLGLRAWVGFVIWCVLSSVCVCCYPFPISPLGWCFRYWTESMDRKNRIKNSCRSCERFNYEHPFGGLMFLISGPNC